jgi:WD40 repeat protein
MMQSYRGHSRPIKALAWSPDGETIASGSDDTTVQLWSPQTGKQLTIFDEHPAWIRSVAWSPDSTQLAVASDKIVALWDVGAR